MRMLMVAGIVVATVGTTAVIRATPVQVPPMLLPGSTDLVVGHFAARCTNVQRFARPRSGRAGRSPTRASACRVHCRSISGRMPRSRASSLTRRSPTPASRTASSLNLGKPPTSPRRLTHRTTLLLLARSCLHSTPRP
jgi:hypothetical protein